MIIPVECNMPTLKQVRFPTTNTTEFNFGIYNNDDRLHRLHHQNTNNLLRTLPKVKQRTLAPSPRCLTSNYLAGAEIRAPTNTSSSNVYKQHTDCCTERASPSLVDDRGGRASSCRGDAEARRLSTRAIEICERLKNIHGNMQTTLDVVHI